MKITESKILFMGTPDFAVPILNALVENGLNVVGVVTQPDKPSGRGYKLTPPPVKLAAEANGIEVYQPVTLKKRKFAELLQRLSPELIIVAAFGKILPPSVLEFPRFGCINVHGSLLPKYRGAAPMQRAIIDGERETGVTIMQMADGIDTGDMLYKASLPIGEDDNFETVHDALAALGAASLIKTLHMLDGDSITPQKQDDSLASYADKIEIDDCLLDFNNSARSLHNRIRGLSPFPLAFTSHRGKKLKITSASVINEGSDFIGEVITAGTVISTSNGVIAIACGEGTLALTGVLPEGKRRMTSADFINGRGIAVGDILGGEE